MIERGARHLRSLQDGRERLPILEGGDEVDLCAIAINVDDIRSCGMAQSEGGGRFGEQEPREPQVLCERRPKELDRELFVFVRLLRFWLSGIRAPRKEHIPKRACRYPRKKLISPDPPHAVRRP
jgi:hypothetical protein